MKAIYWVLLLVIFTGCATTAGYENKLKSWVGHDINSLIASWGAPSGSMTLPNGDAVYTWYFDGGAVAIPVGNMAYATNRYCKTSFTTNQDGRIQSWSYRGNMCRSY